MLSRVGFPLVPVSPAAQVTPFYLFGPGKSVSHIKSAVKHSPSVSAASRFFFHPCRIFARSGFHSFNLLLVILLTRFTFNSFHLPVVSPSIRISYHSPFRAFHAFRFSRSLQSFFVSLFPLHVFRPNFSLSRFPSHVFRPRFSAPCFSKPAESCFIFLPFRPRLLRPEYFNPRGVTATALCSPLTERILLGATFRGIIL